MGTRKPRSKCERATKVFFTKEDYLIASARATAAGNTLPSYLRGLALGSDAPQGSDALLARMRRAAADPARVRLIRMLLLVAAQQDRIAAILNAMRDQCTPCNWDSIEAEYLCLRSALSDIRTQVLRP